MGFKLRLRGRTAHVDVQIELVHKAFVGLGDGASLTEERKGLDYREGFGRQRDHVGVIGGGLRSWRDLA